MDVVCQHCKSKIKSENINVAKDAAYCSACDKTTALSELLNPTVKSHFIPGSSEAGINIVEQSFSWAIKASHFGPNSLFMIPLTALWAGGSFSMTYWPQIARGEFNLHDSLFGLPFFIISLVLIALTLLALFGQTVISNENGRALIFIGVGKIGHYRLFEWSSIEKVAMSLNPDHRNVSLEGGSVLSFGLGLSSKKLYFSSEPRYPYPQNILIEVSSRLNFGWGLSIKQLNFAASYLQSKLKK